MAYFRSGWAFLIPYLAAYLLYAWLKWPVNTVDGGQLTVVPCLLHVYWFLHAVHLLLGMIAIRSWWRSARKEQGTLQPCSELTRNAEQVTGNRLLSTVYRLLPWLCLALLFWIPGVYLEYPSDPWEHYSRINEWGHVGLVTDHPTWTKSSYFLAYSLLGQLSGSRQLWWLDGYFTAACLLLCWQYFLLARTVGLPTALAMLFVLLQVFLFGNNLFSFYRYYGIASTLFSQIGTIALIRIGAESAMLLRAETATLPRSRFLVVAAITVLPLVALIRYNHVQGLGLAALGLGTIGLWAIVDWRHSAKWGLAAGALVFSLAAWQYCPRHPEIDSYFVPEGWLNAWYGFNVFSPQTVTGGRTLQILGCAGVLNFLAGLWLMRSNHLVGWLSLTPILALCLPIVSIPLTNLFLTEGGGNTITNMLTFHRMFLGIPAGLALVVLLEQRSGRPMQSAGGLLPFPRMVAPGVLPLLLGAAMVLPAGNPAFNRTWNTLAMVPADLAMQPSLRQLQELPVSRLPERGPEILTTRAMSFAAHAAGEGPMLRFADQRYLEPYHIPAVYAASLLGIINRSQAAPIRFRLFLPAGTALQSLGSQAGYLSGHWLPHFVALDRTGSAEMVNAADQFGHAATQADGTKSYLLP